MTTMSYVLPKRWRAPLSTTDPMTPKLDLSACKAALCNSRQVLDAAYAAGLRRDARVLTNAPVLLMDGSSMVRPLEDSVGTENNAAFWQQGGELALQVFRATAASDAADCSIAAARACVQFHKAAHGLLGISDADLETPIAILLADTGEMAKDEWINPKWDELLTRLPNAVHRRFPATLPGKIVEEVAPLRYRLRLLDMGRVFYRLASKFRGKGPVRADKNRALIIGENDLLIDAAIPLIRSGVALREISPPRLSPPPDVEAAASAVADRITDQLRPEIDRFLARWFPAPVHAGLVDYFKAACGRLIAQQQAGYAAWQAVLEPHVERGRTVVLANHASQPNMLGLAQWCRQHDVPIVTFQHGVAAEICATNDPWGAYYETTVADGLIAFNAAAARLASDHPYAHGRGHVAGMPAVYKRLKKMRPAVDAPILYVSTGLLAGNVNVKNGSLSDLQRLKRELSIAEQVLNRIPHRVLYKTYPALPRFTEPDPDLARLRSLENLDVFDALIDLRYLLNHSRVIVSARATSTISWCLMTDKPLVLINMPEQANLRDDVLPAFAESVFLFSFDEPDVIGRLREFLAQPIDRIEAAWRNKQPARDALMEQYVSGPPGDAGRRAADIIQGYLRH